MTIRRALLLVAVLATLGLPGCAQNPVTGESDFVLMSEDQELAMGRQASRQVRREYAVYEDRELQRYVAGIGRRLAALSHRPGLVYHFTVLDSQEVNAFSLPGGYVYVARGLLAQLNSEAELAAVLGHEIGHVTARHAVRQYSAQQAAGIGFALGAILVPELGRQTTRDLYQLLGGALIRGYGREHELEADRLGAQYLARAGYDPLAVLDVLRVLKAQERWEIERARREGREPRVYHGLFATHPDNDTRLRKVLDEARALARRSPRTVEREAYLRHLDGMTFGPSAREGVLRGNRFYHRELGIGLRFPPGWRVENRPDRLIARPPGGDALLQVRIADRNRRMDPREFLVRRLGLRDLRSGRTVSAGPLPGYTGLAWAKTPFGRRLTRFTVIYHEDRAYLFAAARRDPRERLRYRSEFLDTALSLHPLAGEEWRLAEERHIRIRRADPGATWARLAAESGLGEDGEALLRLLNHQYPSGEPTPGSLIKTVE